LRSSCTAHDTSEPNVVVAIMHGLVLVVVVADVVVADVAVVVVVAP
jgi:hypothetical protein